MKTVIGLLFALIAIGCKGQVEKVQVIEAAKVHQIVLNNRLKCYQNDYSEGKLIINDQSEIDEFISYFNRLKPIENQQINVQSNFGFFEINFTAANVNYYYVVLYTTYDGVILWNQNNGNMFRDNILEQYIKSKYVRKQ